MVPTGRNETTDAALAILAHRRAAGQRLGAPLAAGEVVSWLGAVQAQDYLASLWAVGVRTLSAAAADVEAALAAGTIVRTWALRGTIHLVAATDLRWIVALAGPRAIARAAGRFRQLGLDDVTFARARAVVLRLLAGGAPVPRRELMRALERRGIATGGQRGVHIVWRLAHEGEICFGPKEGKQETFVLVDAWVGGGPRRPVRAGRGELARRYFASRGPATVADFAWWAGWSQGEARGALDEVRAQLVAEEHDGATYWRTAGRAPHSRRGVAFLLPAFDELLVGYDDRRAVVAPAFHARVHRGGMLGPIVVVDGRAVGTWRRTLSRRGVKIAVSAFERLAVPTERSVAAAALRYAAFLGLPLEGISVSR